jgi:hypothetical protein
MHYKGGTIHYAAGRYYTFIYTHALIHTLIHANTQTLTLTPNTRTLVHSYTRTLTHPYTHTPFILQSAPRYKHMHSMRLLKEAQAKEKQAKILEQVRAVYLPSLPSSHLYPPPTLLLPYPPPTLYPPPTPTLLLPPPSSHSPFLHSPPLTISPARPLSPLSTPSFYPPLLPPPSYPPSYPPPHPSPHPPPSPHRRRRMSGRGGKSRRRWTGWGDRR